MPSISPSPVVLLLVQVDVDSRGHARRRLQFAPITHTNLVRESFLQDPYDRQRPGRSGLSERRKGSVMSRFPLTKV
jgi:hypothetical protein